MSKRDEIVKLAQEQVGYREYANNKTKYGEWYGLQGEWCDIFISWLAYKVGILNILIPKEAYVPNTAKWYKNKGLLKDKNYKPQKGDLILFDYNRNRNADHIGIVEYVDKNVIHTIEGNKSKMVKRQQYAIGNSNILGIAVVQYKEEQKPTTPSAPKKYVLGKYIVNTPRGLNVRSGPGTNYKIKKTYKNGTRFDTLEIKGDWGRSPSGWCNLNYCKLVKAY